jgi:hypothetical protein
MSASIKKKPSRAATSTPDRSRITPENQKLKKYIV